MRLIGLLIGLMWIGWAGTARAELRASLAEGSGGRSWEMICIEYSPREGSVEVSVQDARGGVEFMRRVDGRAGRAWVPLPLVAPSELGGTGAWPVLVGLSAGGEIQRGRVVLMPGQGVGLRVAATGPVVAVAQGLCVSLPEEEILAAPALLFAGVDMVYVDAAALQRLTPERSLALLAAGVRLATPAQAESGPLPAPRVVPGLIWERQYLSAGVPAWVTAAVPARRPEVIEPGLEPLARGAVSKMPAALTWAIMLTGPIAAGMLLVSYGLFRRRAWVLVTSSLMMACVAGMAVLYVRGRDLSQENCGQWRQTVVPAKGGAAVTLDEQLVCCRTLFGSTVTLEAPAGAQLIPLAAAPEAYWGAGGLAGMRLAFDGATSRLTGGRAARTSLYAVIRSVSLPEGVIPAFPGEAAAERVRHLESLRLHRGDAWWLVEGRITPAGEPSAASELYGTWARGKAWVGPELGAMGRRAWYEMRFTGERRYLVFERHGMMNLLDYGTADPVSRGKGGAPGFP